ncbi:MAG TPA: HD domain-containing phosphohydrolase [Anaerolineales bacterium]|nr:HD domain-containing phosphohydrolase [Anaerolineales bacterium]
MSRTSLSKILVVVAGTLSLSAQGILLIPTLLGLHDEGGSIFTSATSGAFLFALAVLLLIITSFRSSADAHTQRANIILLMIQIFTLFGIYFLLDGRHPDEGMAGFILSSMVTLVTTYGIFTHIISAKEPAAPAVEAQTPPPNVIVNPGVDISVLKEQIDALTRQLAAEKYRNTQLTLLNELSQQLETELDPPVAAQLAINTLERAMDCSFVSLMTAENDRQEYVVLASAGKMTSTIPPGYRQGSSTGLVGRTNRIRKTQLVNDTELDHDFIRLSGDNTLSIINVPMLQHGHVKGILEICSEKKYAFSSADVSIAEGVAAVLMRAWERSSYRQRLTELIQAGISLTTLLDPQAAVQEVAVIARQTLEAQFVFVTLLDQQGNFSRTASAGEAPKLLSTLNANPVDEPIMHAALNATKPFRVRDLRKYSNARKVEIDHPGLRSVLAIPIRLHRLSIGTILAFGKQESVFFSENDESLADLLSSQAAASIESSWLYQELRSTLNITSMLYQLSVDVIQTEELSMAAELIAQVAHKVTNSRETGIVLMTREGRIQAEVEIDARGLHTRREHPTETIDQAIQNGQSIIVSVENGSLVCYPLLTPRRTYGALWMSIPESRGQNFANLQTLANQAAIALERSILLSESRQQAKQLEAAYAELELTYDRTLTALSSALDARDRETEGHSTRVSRLTRLLGEEIGLSGQQLKALERGALLHDIGKIGIKDEILHKPGKLTDEEWKTMRVHPDIGARIVEGIPFLQDTLPVIRYHHERWDGSGYPVGLKTNEIPIQARIFAIADVFDALTSKRTYRKKSSADEAVEYIKEQAGILFDPMIVEALTRIPYEGLTEGEKIIA